MDYKLPKRIENSNKSTYGRVLNFAGSDYMSGAAYLSSVSALKTGCGYCFLCSTDRVMDIVAAKTSNIVFLPLSDLTQNLDSFDVVMCGCGLSQSDVTLAKLTDLFAGLNPKTPLVIDADAINLISKTPQIFLSKRFEKVIMTPHPKEAARLLNSSVEEVLSEVRLSAEKIAAKYNCVTVLKTHNTVIVSPSGEFYENHTGNNSMAKAGSGDVLTGMISGIAAQGANLFEAAVLGVYLHGMSGEIASKSLTNYSVMAEDLIANIPNAIIFCNVSKR